MTTLTHTAALPVMPGNGTSLFESARGAFRRARSAMGGSRQSRTGCHGAADPTIRPAVVYMRFHA